VGKSVIHGPLLDSFATRTEIGGIGVLKTNSLAEASWVKKGRLIIELYTWTVNKNILP
jgi:hypothetical protein